MTLSVHDAAAEAPSRAALVVAERTLDWQDLATHAERAAAALVAHGVAPRASTPVAVVADWRPDVIAAVLALFDLDVPVVLLHPRWTSIERTRAIDSTRAATLIDESWRLGDSPARARALARPVAQDDRTLAVAFTSGSAGVPRGVDLTRGALVASARASERNLGWQDGDRWLACMPLAHVGGLSILIRSLCARRTIVATSEPRFDPASVARTIALERVTIASLVPTMLERLLALDWQPPASLRAVLLGGAPASPALLARARARGVPVLRTYGLTETSSQVATDRAGEVAEPRDGIAAVDGAEVRVVDGTIELRGPMLARGYLTPVPTPLALTPDGFFVTGDRGSLDAQGRVRVLGRSDDVIVTGGENVDPVEVEQALEACPGVASACVFAMPDAAWGSVVCAAIVASDADAPTDRELTRVLGERLAGFKRPRRIARTIALCTAPSGKLDRRATAALAAPKLRPLG